MGHFIWETVDTLCLDYLAEKRNNSLQLVIIVTQLPATPNLDQSDLGNLVYYAKKIIFSPWRTASGAVLCLDFNRLFLKIFLGFDKTVFIAVSTSYCCL